MEKRGAKQTEYVLPELNVPDGFFTNYHAAHGRSFPWRKENTSPFGILVAEILLKQTHANKVAKVWPSLVNQYRDADELAAADPHQLLTTIAELGFGNQRTSALIELASSIKQSGDVPYGVKDLLNLPYVGIYTAHAVACFAFDQRVPVVDLSVIRVISRITGVNAPKDIRRAPLIWGVAWAALPQQDVKEHNYGLLDFAAAICKPRGPICDGCVIAAECAYAMQILEVSTRP